MYKNTLVLTFFLILISQPLQALHVVIDPGHGGSDKGAVYNNVKESSLVLQIAKELKKSLEQQGSFKITMTRDNDQLLSLEDRVKKAEQHKADLFISLHANAALDKRAKGAELYFQNHLPPEEEEMFLAHLENNQSKKITHELIDPLTLSKKSDINTIIEDLKHQSRLRKSLQFTEILANTWESSKIKQAPFFVVSQTSMPSVLIEIGFLSNPKEFQRLISLDNQQKIVQKIVKAVQQFKEKVDKPQSTRLD